MHYCRILPLTLLLMCLYCSPTLGAPWAWGIAPPFPAYDPAWQEVRDLWDRHWDGANTDELISKVQALEKRYPDKPEPALWLARLYLYRGDTQRRHKRENYQTAARYAVQAHRLDRKDRTALKILACTMPSIESTSSALRTHDEWIREAAPLPEGWIVPEMQGETWEQAITLFKDRPQDHRKGLQALALFNRIANERPRDGLAQTWASFANYDIGEYYTALGEHETKALPYYKAGMVYGQKALKLEPHSVPAHFWYQCNLARSIQYTSLLNKARYLNPLLKHMVFCAHEDYFYNYFGPCLALSTMITNGGWVTEKGMAMAGVSLESVYRTLEWAEILFPHNLCILYARADILAYQGKKQEAIKLCEEILRRKPDESPYSTMGNMNNQRFTHALYERLKH